MTCRSSNNVAVVVAAGRLSPTRFGLADVERGDPGDNLFLVLRLGQHSRIISPYARAF